MVAVAATPTMILKDFVTGTVSFARVVLTRVASLVASS
jgi:hypothetical protein